MSNKQQIEMQLLWSASTISGRLWKKANFNIGLVGTGHFVNFKEFSIGLGEKVEGLIRTILYLVWSFNRQVKGA